jgi:signal peptidase I
LKPVGDNQSVRGYSRGDLASTTNYQVSPMPELTGSLSNFDLATLVRFLCGLGTSGDLLVSRGPWIGQLAVDHGRLIAAGVVDELGLPALDFIAAVMTSGEFDFSEGPPTLAPNLQPDVDPLTTVERLSSGAAQTGISRLLPPTVIPRVLELSDSEDRIVSLCRTAIYVVRDIDGARTVRDIAARHGLLRTLRALDQLHQLELITFDSGQPPSRDDRTGGAPRLSVSPGMAAQPAHGAGLAPERVDRLSTWRSRLQGDRLRTVARALAQAIVITGLCIFGMRSMVQSSRVEGISMLPTFQGGEALVINRAAYFHVEASPLATILPTTHQGSIRYVFGGPRRGDVVVFHGPQQPDADYIKRIIGLPGESVLVREGRVFINGQHLDEPYIDFPATYEFPPSHEAITVPDGNYFVLGDNRPDSFDSHLGWFVPVDNLVGRAWLRYWPPGELGILQRGHAVHASSRPRAARQAPSSAAVWTPWATSTAPYAASTRLDTTSRPR